jgi:hypothetical protein
MSVGLAVMVLFIDAVVFVVFTVLVVVLFTAPVNPHLTNVQLHEML